MRRALGLAFWLGVIGMLLAALGPWREDLFALIEGNRIVARGDQVSIRQREVAEALREHLWRTGGQWAGLAPDARQKLRETVLQELIDQGLVRAARQGPGAAPQAKPHAVTEELLWFQHQLGFSEGRYNEGLRSQGFSEKSLSDRMQAQLEDQAWIESKIEPKLTAVLEADARLWFDSHHAELGVTQATHAAHLFLSSHDPSQPDRRLKIQNLSAALKEGKALFEDLVAKNSEDERTKLHGGDLGWFTEARMPQDFMAEVDKLQPGQISEPVQTELGWHLIKLIERKPARPLTFEEAKGEILAHLRNAQREKAVQALLAELRSQHPVARDEAALAQTMAAE